MRYNINSKGFELHASQTFIIERGLAKLNRLCKHFPEDAVNATVVISCHQKTPDSKPTFNSHIHLDVPGQNIAAVTSEKNFSLSFNEALAQARRQLRAHKTKLRGKRNYDQARKLKGSA